VAKKPETSFKEKVLKDLRKLPKSWWVKTQQVSISGTPDILGCLDGKFIAIELKRSLKASISPLQEYNLKLISAVACGVGIVTSPENWDKTITMLREEL
jgi:hypothetical protein